MKGAKVFENTAYKTEWIEKVPGTNHFYKMGTMSQSDVNENIYHVYDGAQNYMGTVSVDGEIHINGSESDDYKTSFLTEALKVLKQ